MTPSMFDVFCPVCGGAITPPAPDEGQCPGCGARYLVRVGYLIPVPPPVPQSPSPTGAPW